MSGDTRKYLTKILKERSGQRKFVPGVSRIPLAVPPFGPEEVIEALDSLMSGNLTMGVKVSMFERMLADYLGVTGAVMVNSGSSANLLAMSILANPAAENRLKNGAEVITPALTWATTVYPISNVGATPVLVDVDSKTFDIDSRKIADAIGPKTRAIMLVHLLGNPCDMDAIMKLAREHDLLVVEDSCEAHGATYRGRKVGSFGAMGTFSFFLSHHISTIEGGMVASDNDSYVELARALRAFGWIRDLRNKKTLARRNPGIDPRYLFVNVGFNMRPTEIQGAFGIHQLAKLEPLIEMRRDNVRYWNDRLRKHDRYLMLPTETPHSRHVYFGYALTVRRHTPFTREAITSNLESKLIETRAVMAGNIAEQPVMKMVRHRIPGSLSNAHYIMHHSFFFGNHQDVGPVEREYIADCVDEFISNNT